MKPSENLRKIKKQWWMFLLYGICHHYRIIAKCELSEHMILHKIRLIDWHLYTGEPAFPVPHDYKTPSLAFNSTIFYFNPFTKYGRTRRKLLQWLIEEFEKRGA